MSEKQKNGQTAALETDIRKISIKLIDGFPNHPFYVFDDDEMRTWLKVSGETVWFRRLLYEKKLIGLSWFPGIAGNMPVSF